MNKHCKVIILFIAILIAKCLCFTVFAEDPACKENSLYGDPTDEIAEIIPEDTKNILDSIGISAYSPEELANIGISDVFKAITDIFRGSLKRPFRFMSLISGLMILTATAGTLISDNAAFASYYESLTSLITALPAFSGMIDCIHSAVSAIYGSNIFLKTFIPITAGLTAAAGEPTLAIGYNAITLYVAEIISAICNDFLAPIMCIFAAVSVCASVNTAVNFSSLMNGIKKTVNIILGFCGVLFTGILSVKNILSSGIDKVSVRSLKFILGSSVPIVGGSISEGLASVIASISLMKNTCGVLGIIITAVIILPVIAEILLWMLSLTLSSYIAEALGMNKVSDMLSSLHFTVSVLFSIIIFIAYISVISTAMVVLIGNSGK